MGKSKDKKYRYRKRIFLNEDYESFTYVIAAVENSKRFDSLGKKGESGKSVTLIFESSYDRVTVNFELDLPDQIKESLSKIRKFETLLKQFRKAVEKEARAREKQSYDHIKDKIITVR